MRGRWVAVGPALAVVDPAVVAVAIVLSVSQVGWGPVVLGAEAAFLITLATGRQRSRLTMTLVRDVPVLLIAAVAATATVVLTSDVLAVRRTEGWLEAGALALLLFIVLALARGVVYAVARLLRGTRRFAREVVVVGTGDGGRRMAEALTARPQVGLVPVGFVDCGKRSNPRGLPLPFLGGLDALPGVLAEHADADVVFCCDAMPDEATEDVVRDALRPPRRVFVAPGLWQREARGRFEQVGDVRLLLLSGWPRPRPQGQRRRVKRPASAPAPLADKSQVHAGQLAS